MNKLVNLSSEWRENIGASYQFLAISNTLSTHLNNYFDFHVCLSFRPSVRPSVRASVRRIAQIPAVVSQNVTNKSCLVCAKSEKYSFWVTLRPQSDCCCGGEAEVRILDFKTTWSEFQRGSQTATE